MVEQVFTCLRTMSHQTPWALSTYESIEGYKQWRRVLNEKMDRQAIIDAVKASNLRGRGGAGFPTGLKWSFVPADSERPKYMLCNSDESEPGTFKDRDIMIYNPHQLIEGLAIACYATGAKVAYNLMRGEFYEPFERFEAALEEAYAAGLLGKNILGSGVDVDIHTHRTAGAYICGEETALMNALEGKRPLPRYKPPFPANAGLYQNPTNINNTETFASVPLILERGPQWFANLGTEKSGGTKIFCMSGHVKKPGNYEVCMGTPFSELLELAGGMLDGSKLKAVIPGGSSMPVLPAEVMMKTHMDYESIMKAGSMLGSGGVIVMDHKTCMVQVLARMAYFYWHESCGQCSPCREGTGWLYRLVEKVERGEGTMADLDRLVKVANDIEGRTICAFGEAAAWPVTGMLRHFYDEFLHHVTHGCCLPETI